MCIVTARRKWVNDMTKGLTLEAANDDGDHCDKPEFFDRKDMSFKSSYLIEL
jgi:hypothetical protein